MKSIVIFIFLLFCLATNAYSEVVKKIDIKGNERISSDTIIIFGDLITNKNYESDDINLIIKKLFETNFFSNIDVELRNGILSINVKENPIINTIIFKGVKAEKHKAALSEVIELREKTPFIKNSVNQQKYF